MQDIPSERRPTPERFEQVLSNYASGNEDPDFEVEVLDISAAGAEYDSDSEAEEEKETNSVQKNATSELFWELHQHVQFSAE